MSQVFFNGEFMPFEQVKISPLDRGFLFGDGVYEVILYEQQHFIGLEEHLARLNQSLDAIQLKVDITKAQWKTILTTLITSNKIEHGSVYIHISRGVQLKRSHVVNDDLTPTVLAIANELPKINKSLHLKVKTQLDTRWHNCHIKSTALLANVMYLQDASDNNADEVILYDSKHEITEGASSNVFAVFGNVIKTPPLQQNILPGVTRKLLIQMLEADSTYTVCEEVITLSELAQADEIWLTSSTKNVAPVIEVDGRKVSGGEPGVVWKAVSDAFAQYKLASKA